MAVARFLLDGVEVALDCVLDSADAGVDDGKDVVHLRGPFLRLYRLQDLQGREVSVQADEGDSGVVVLIWAEEGDRCVVVHIGEGLEAAGVGAVHCGGVDGVLDHTLSVEVEVELHRTQLRVDLLLCVRVPPVLYMWSRIRWIGRFTYDFTQKKTSPTTAGDKKDRKYESACNEKSEGKFTHISTHTLSAQVGIRKQKK